MRTRVVPGITAMPSRAPISQTMPDTGEVTVTRAEQSGPDRIDLEVGIVYGDDGHLAADATVTATLLGPSGDSIGPVTLQRVDPNSSLFAGVVAGVYAKPRWYGLSATYRFGAP